MTARGSATGKSFIIWFFAVVLTFTAVVWQRKTGPTHPLRGSYRANGRVWTYSLIRNPTTDAPLNVFLPGPGSYSAELVWREYPTEFSWKTSPMVFTGDGFAGAIPVQPPAGKVEFYLALSAESQPDLRVPEHPQTVIARYKNDVPHWALLPHIVLMFAAMLFSNRAGLSVLFGEKTPNRLVLLTFVAIVTGALVYGPIVQKYAFGSFWTGWPAGTDLTDNKSAAAVLAWLVPVIGILRKKNCRKSTLVAALITLAIYGIPHSLYGSEYDYSKNSGTQSIRQ